MKVYRKIIKSVNSNISETQRAAKRGNLSLSVKHLGEAGRLCAPVCSSQLPHEAVYTPLNLLMSKLLWETQVTI